MKKILLLMLLFISSLGAYCQSLTLTNNSCLDIVVNVAATCANCSSIANTGYLRVNAHTTVTYGSSSALSSWTPSDPQLICNNNWQYNAAQYANACLVSTATNCPGCCPYDVNSIGDAGIWNSCTPTGNSCITPTTSCGAFTCGTGVTVSATWVNAYTGPISHANYLGSTITFN